MTERKPAVHKPSAQSALKTLHRKFKKANEYLSLKEFVRSLSPDKDRDLFEKVTNWLHNKRENFTKPPMGLGATRKKATQNGKR